MLLRPFDMIGCSYFLFLYVTTVHGHWLKCDWQKKQNTFNQESSFPRSVNMFSNKITAALGRSMILFNMALLIISLIGEKGDKWRWNIVCVQRLSSTLPENIDLHFTFHRVARCCAFINQHGGLFMMTNVFRVLLLSVHFSSLTKPSLSITIWPPIVA